MLFMNEYEVNRALEVHAGHDVLGPATRSLEELVYWTNTHSDGWPYWAKPCRAAAKLQALIQKYSYPCSYVPVDEYRAALKPIKAFRTRQQADFPLYDVEYKVV